MSKPAPIIKVSFEAFCFSGIFMIMQIKLNQLRQIIREELSQHLCEITLLERSDNDNIKVSYDDGSKKELSYDEMLDLIKQKKLSGEKYQHLLQMLKSLKK
jgi:hypothetical protein